MSVNCVPCLSAALLTAVVLGGCGGGSTGQDLVINTAPPVNTGGGGDTSSSPNDPFPVSDAFEGNGNRMGLDPMLNSDGTPGDSSPDLQGAEWTFRSSSPDLQGDAYAISLGGKFEDVNYVGAFAQDTDDVWTADWTVAVHGNSTVWEPKGGNPSANSDCPEGTTYDSSQTLPESVGGGSMDVCLLARRYDTDGQTVTLTGDNIYRLASGFPGTYIGNGEAADGNAGNDVSVTLVIESGALILGSQQEALIVTRGSRVEASGTAADPIVMTSRQQFDDWVQGDRRADGRGEWAGLALMGYGRSNECGSPCDVNAEGNIGAYGGTDDSDDSGFIRYTVIRHAGNDIDGNGNELNGLTMFATGSGTEASHVQVHYGSDDGVEHFGATDHMDHIVITGAGDDSFDWGQGYRGTAQFVLIVQARDDGDRGIEADNDGDNPLAEPVSRPTLANFTILGAADSREASADGILLRRGTGALLHNFLVANFRDACLDVDGSATQDRFGDDLTIRNSLFYCPAGEVYESGDDDVPVSAIADWVNTDPNNQVTAPNLRADYRPNPVDADAGSMFVTTDYVGAFAQDTEDNWTQGWTVSLNGNNTVWQPAVEDPSADGSCPEGTTAEGTLNLPAGVGGGQMDLCRMQRRYDTGGSTITLTSDNIYAPAAGFPGTYIGNGEDADGDAGNNVSVTLRIQKGTLILGSSGEAVVVTRGSRIEADGTAEDPIVMTSRSQFEDWADGGDGTAGRGEWAGLALMGYARSNECGTPCDVAAEGNIGAYGGNDDSDGSGYIRYLVIRHAGNDIDGNGNELNGLTLFATGSGTRVSYVQVHKGLDDGVEHFGASDFMDHIVITDAADDSYDWGQGYRGGAQFVVIRQASDDADRGIEADNDGDAPNAEPISGPVLANFTMIGTEEGGAATIGVLLRRGTGAFMWNSVITGFNRCVDFDDEATFGRYNTGAIGFRNNVVSCAVNFDEE